MRGLPVALGGEQAREAATDLRCEQRGRDGLAETNRGVEVLERVVDPSFGRRDFGPGPTEKGLQGRR